MAIDTAASLPSQAEDPASLKGTYRLFDSPAVTHEAVTAPHFAWTLEQMKQLPRVLIIQDTSALSMTSHEACEGLGPIGHDKGERGLHQQTALAVDPARAWPIGMVHQRYYARTPRPQGMTRAKRAQVPPEDREGHWWVQPIEEIGSPPEGTQWIHMGNRGEDMFAVYAAATRQGTDWIIRAAQDRCILVDGEPHHLLTFIRSQKATTKRTLTVRRDTDGEIEDVELQISSARVEILRPQQDPYQRDEAPISAVIVRVWEKKTPKGCTPIEWVLVTSLPCETPAEAREVAKLYEHRWLIEEFHKCQKTGCRMEHRYLRNVDRLEPLFGLLSIMSVFLLHLKLVSREHPKKRASTMIDEVSIAIMSEIVNRPASKMTVGEFWGGIGKLGGHFGRKSDGPLGWLRAWKGWCKFQMMLKGAEIQLQIIKKKGTKKRCG